MGQAITVMYEKGVFRPLMPLRLKDRSLVQIQIISEPQAEEAEREEALRVLREAGVIRPHPPAPQRVPVDEGRLEAARKALGAAGPLSELIIAERDGR
jgi:predicted DNA-binding antitoxin AbrB/MazE fold protein